MPLPHNVDICITCVTDKPPKLPLKEELPSLGIEVIYNAQGIGAKASKHEAKKLIKKFRQNEQVKELKKRRFFPPTSKRIKEKVKERKRIERQLQIPTALSYEKYERRLNSMGSSTQSSSSDSSWSHSTPTDKSELMALPGSPQQKDDKKPIVPSPFGFTMSPKKKGSDSSSHNGPESPEPQVLLIPSVEQTEGSGEMKDAHPDVFLNLDLTPSSERDTTMSDSTSRDPSSLSTNFTSKGSAQKQGLPAPVQVMSSSATKKFLPGLKTVSESDDERQRAGKSIVKRPVKDTLQGLEKRTTKSSIGSPRPGKLITNLSPKTPKSAVKDSITDPPDKVKNVGTNNNAVKNAFAAFDAGDKIYSQFDPPGRQGSEISTKENEQKISQTSKQDNSKTPQQVKAEAMAEDWIESAKQAFENVAEKVYKSVAGVEAKENKEFSQDAGGYLPVSTPPRSPRQSESGHPRIDGTPRKDAEASGVPGPSSQSKNSDDGGFSHVEIHVRPDGKAVSVSSSISTTSAYTFFDALAHKMTPLDNLQAMLQACPKLVKVKLKGDGRLALHAACDRGFPNRFSKPSPSLATDLVNDIAMYKILIELLVKSYRDACKIKDSSGDLPAHLLARRLMEWEALWYESVYENVQKDKDVDGRNAAAITSLYQTMSSCIETVLNPVAQTKEICTAAGSVGRILPLHIASIFTASVDTLRLLLEQNPGAATIPVDLGNLATFIPNKSLPLELHDKLSTDFPKWESGPTDSQSISEKSLNSSQANGNMRRSDLIFAYNPNVTRFRLDKQRIRRLESMIRFEARALGERGGQLSQVVVLTWIFMCTFTESNKTATYVPCIKRILASLPAPSVRYLASVKTRDGSRLIDAATSECAQLIRKSLDDFPDTTTLSSIKSFPPNSESVSQRPGHRTSVERPPPTKRYSLKGKGYVGILCRLIFNIRETSFPTSFVLLPYKLTKNEYGKLGIDSAASATTAVRFAECLLQLTDPNTILYYLDKKSIQQSDQRLLSDNNLNSPITSEAKVQEIERILLSLYEPGKAYLYLMDEFIGLPIVPTGNSAYPIEIKGPANIVRKLLPMMLTGMILMRGEKALSVLVNVLLHKDVIYVSRNWVETAREIISYLYSQQDGPENSLPGLASLIDELLSFISYHSKTKPASNAEESIGSAWNVELSMLKMMIQMNDSKRTFSGLRVKREDQSTILWTKHELEDDGKTGQPAEAQLNSAMPEGDKQSISSLSRNRVEPQPVVDAVKHLVDYPIQQQHPTDHPIEEQVDHPGHTVHSPNPVEQPPDHPDGNGVENSAEGPSQQRPEHPANVSTVPDVGVQKDADSTARQSDGSEAGLRERDELNRKVTVREQRKEVNTTTALDKISAAVEGVNNEPIDNNGSMKDDGSAFGSTRSLIDNYEDSTEDEASGGSLASAEVENDSDKADSESQSGPDEKYREGLTKLLEESASKYNDAVPGRSGLSGALENSDSSIEEKQNKNTYSMLLTHLETITDSEGRGCTDDESGRNSSDSDEFVRDYPVQPSDAMLDGNMDTMIQPKAGGTMLNEKMDTMIQPKATAGQGLPVSRVDGKLERRKSRGNTPQSREEALKVQEILHDVSEQTGQIAENEFIQKMSSHEQGLKTSRMDDKIEIMKLRDESQLSQNDEFIQNISTHEQGIKTSRMDEKLEERIKLREDSEQSQNDVIVEKTRRKREEERIHNAVQQAESAGSISEQEQQNRNYSQQDLSRNASQNGGGKSKEELLRDIVEQAANTSEEELLHGILEQAGSSSEEELLHSIVEKTGSSSEDLLHRLDSIVEQSGTESEDDKIRIVERKLEKLLLEKAKLERKRDKKHLPFWKQRRHDMSDVVVEKLKSSMSEDDRDIHDAVDQSETGKNMSKVSLAGRKSVTSKLERVRFEKSEDDHDLLHNVVDQNETDSEEDNKMIQINTHLSGKNMSKSSLAGRKFGKSNLHRDLLHGAVGRSGTESEDKMIEMNKRLTGKNISKISLAGRMPGKSNLERVRFENSEDDRDILHSDVDESETESEEDKMIQLKAHLTGQNRSHSKLERVRFEHSGDHRELLQGVIDHSESESEEDKMIQLKSHLAGPSTSNISFAGRKSGKSHLERVRFENSEDNHDLNDAVDQSETDSEEENMIQINTPLTRKNISTMGRKFGHTNLERVRFEKLDDDGDLLDDLNVSETETDSEEDRAEEDRAIQVNTHPTRRNMSKVSLMRRKLGKSKVATAKFEALPSERSEALGRDWKQRNHDDSISRDRERLQDQMIQLKAQLTGQAMKISRVGAAAEKLESREEKLLSRGELMNEFVHDLIEQTEKLRVLDLSGLKRLQARCDILEENILCNEIQQQHISFDLYAIEKEMDEKVEHLKDGEYRRSLFKIMNSSGEEVDVISLVEPMDNNAAPQKPLEVNVERVVPRRNMLMDGDDSIRDESETDEIDSNYALDGRSVDTDAYMLSRSKSSRSSDLVGYYIEHNDEELTQETDDNSRLRQAHGRESVSSSSVSADANNHHHQTLRPRRQLEPDKYNVNARKIQMHSSVNSDIHSMSSEPYHHPAMGIYGKNLRPPPSPTVSSSELEVSVVSLIDVENFPGDDERSFDYGKKLFG